MMVMQETGYQWKSSGKDIFGKVFIPETEPDKVLIFIHGIGEHVGRYDRWFERFIDMGFAIVTADHHGHGRSAGKRGHFKSYCEPMDFVQMLFDEAQNRFPGLPKFIYGHSMGGNITLNYVLRKEPRIKGAIVSSPWIDLKNQPSAFVRWMAGIVQPVLPALSFHTGISRSQLTVNEAELADYDKDELIHGRITVSTFMELAAAAQYAKTNIKKLHTPLLLMHGTADPIVDYHGVVNLEKQNPDYINLRLFDGFLHEIHKEKQNQQVFDAIKEFVTQLV